MIQINGETMEWEEGMTVRRVLNLRNFIFPLVVVTIDGHHVPRSAFDATPVPDGAIVQVIHLMSGG